MIDWPIYKAHEEDWENVEKTKKQREDKAFKKRYKNVSVVVVDGAGKKIIVGLLCVFFVA